MMITVTNDFHNTEARVHVKDGYINARQIRRCWKKLCSIKGCKCGGELGERGGQDWDEYEYDMDPFTGRIKGVWFKP